MTGLEKINKILFKSNRDGIIRVAPDGQILEANPTLIGMLGYECQDEFIGSNKKSSNSEWQYITEASVKEQLRLQGYTREHERVYTKKNGTKLQARVQLWMVSLNSDTTEIWGIIRKIGRHLSTRERLNLSLEQLKKRNLILLEAREKERKILATNIHDEVGQSMTALRLELELLKQKETCREYCYEKLNRMIGISNEVIQNIQRISGELRQDMVYVLGLKAAIEQYGKEWQERTGIQLSLFLENCRIKPNTALALFRIVQEALTNVARHANAKRTCIRLRKERHGILLQIADDGVGMSKDKLSEYQSIGLLGMRERAEMCGGDIRISSDSGTQIEVKVRFNQSI